MPAPKNRQNKRSNALVITEALLISYTTYITSFFLTYLDVMVPQSLESLSINVLLITFSALLCSLSVGLYAAKLRETFRGIIRRIFVSFALTYLIVEVTTGTFFSSLNMHPYYLPSAISLSIVTLVFFRYFTNRTGSPSST